MQFQFTASKYYTEMSTKERKEYFNRTHRGKTKCVFLPAAFLEELESCAKTLGIRVDDALVMGGKDLIKKVKTATK